MSLIRFAEVSYTYPLGRHPVIRGLNLEIPTGQKISILGHNGCGKSTLLCLANGLFRPQVGQLYWQGKLLEYGRRELQQWRQRVGLAFQNPEQQLVAGTVAEDISYGLCNLGLPQPEIHRRLNQALTDFELGAWAETPLHHLSLGQKRRVALAGVMALQPELLLLDEPTTFLDSRQRQHLFEELERIHQAGTTIVITTHDVNLAVAWADWLVVLAEGQVVLTGTPAVVFSQLEQLPQLNIELPLVWQIWQDLPPEIAGETPTPHTAPECSQRIHQAWAKLKREIGGA